MADRYIMWEGRTGDDARREWRDAFPNSDSPSVWPMYDIRGLGGGATMIGSSALADWLVEHAPADTRWPKPPHDRIVFLAGYDLLDDIKRAGFRFACK